MRSFFAMRSSPASLTAILAKSCHMVSSHYFTNAHFLVDNFPFLKFLGGSHGKPPLRCTCCVPVHPLNHTHNCSFLDDRAITGH